MVETTSLALDEIVVGDRLRQLGRDAVDRLKESITALGGIKTPLSVRFLSNEEGWALVTGRHRLQAAVELRMDRVPVREETGSELDARLWEIAENLHRAELTVTERAEHIEEWRKLTIEKERQVAAPLGGHQPADRGFKKTARELGLPEREVRRAETVAGLPEEVKAEARVLHLDDNQTALLRAAKAPTKEDQIRALREHAVKRVTFSEASVSEKRIRKFQEAAKALSPEEFAIGAEWFDEYRSDGIDRPVADNTSALRATA